MTTNEIKDFLLFCVTVKLHSRWFKIPVETFDAIHYAGLAIYKIAVIMLNLVPLIAIWLLF
ncbi:MAG: hypothetical protein CVU51_04370 [Deltaproteobacteria bacterium HGW-Deltaproteobacteria-1]|nr:MAG: hypothetical protein CVU51_04370 [Deltaproteobacteria bacterium HGW-Deltaproteobacteria-1]